MTEQPSAAPVRAPAKFGAVALLILAVVSFLAPITGTREGTRHAAYRDFARGVWTICQGHTGPDVHAGMVASDAQCSAYLRQDLTGSARGVLACSPELVEHLGALKASTDFAFNAGTGSYCHSTMASRFAAGDIPGGCNAFLAWDKATVDGQLVVVAGLAERRQSERAMCLPAARS